MVGTFHPHISACMLVMYDFYKSDTCFNLFLTLQKSDSIFSIFVAFATDISGAKIARFCVTQNLQPEIRLPILLLSACVNCSGKRSLPFFDVLLDKKVPFVADISADISGAILVKV